MEAFVAGRSLNSPFQISSGHDAMCTYSVGISCTLSLSGGQAGTVYLEQADNQDFDENIIELDRIENGNTGTLTLGLNSVQNITGTLTGAICYNKWCRLRTESNTGSPTFTYKSGYEAII